MTRALAVLVVPLVVAVAIVAMLVTDSGGDDSRPAPGAAAAAASPRVDIPAVVRESEPSVVAVSAQGPEGAGEGSGVIWQPDGLIITNAHVVEGATELEVALASGERLPAEVRSADPFTDLALIEVERDDLPAARFARTLPEVGEDAIAIGSALGFEGTVSAGIVSGLHRSIPSGGRTPALVDLLQTDAPISPGNSGGALLDARGEVIGINVAHIPPTARAVAIGFAIPSPLVIDVARELRDDGRVRHAFLGASLSDLSPEIARQFGLRAQRGAIAAGVRPGGPAARAGVRPGDVIVEVGGTEVESVETIYAALRRRDPGERLGLTLVDDGRRRTATVVLGARR